MIIVAGILWVITVCDPGCSHANYTIYWSDRPLITKILSLVHQRVAWSTCVDATVQNNYSWWQEVRQWIGPW